MLKDPKTDYLFATPSFCSGVARLLDWWGSFDQYNFGSNGEETDAKSILSDWGMVGQDIQHAIIEFEKTAL